jgi:hypothetical protein
MAVPPVSSLPPALPIRPEPLEPVVSPDEEPPLASLRPPLPAPPPLEPVLAEVPAPVSMAPLMM